MQRLQDIHYPKPTSIFAVAPLTSDTTAFHWLFILVDDTGILNLVPFS